MATCKPGSYSTRGRHTVSSSSRTNRSSSSGDVFCDNSGEKCHKPVVKRSFPQETIWNYTMLHHTCRPDSPPKVLFRIAPLEEQYAPTLFSMREQELARVRCVEVRPPP